MHVVNKQGMGKLVLAASIAAMFGLAASPVLAEDEALIDKLYEKGYLTEDEYNELGGDSTGMKADDGNAMVGSFKGGAPRWESKDGKNSLLLHGRVQVDYRSSDVPDSTDSFDVRRAYLGVKGKLYEKWTYEVTGDWGRDSGPRLEYAYVDYKWSSAIRARAGHFKFPFGFSQLTSSRFTDFMERTYTDDFEPGKDQGVMIYGQPRKNVFSYAVGYANDGGGRANQPDTDTKGLIARGAVNFAPMVNFDKGVLHLGVDYRDGAFTVGAGPNNEFDRKATGLEAVGAYGPFRLQSEFLTVDLSTDSPADPDVDVYYVNAMWMITGEQYVDNYSINGMKAIKPLKPLGSGGMGAWELGVQLAELDADQSQSGTDNVKSTTVGLKWIPVTNVRFLLNLVENKYETPITVSGQPVDKETQVNGRVQLYF
jgi:phosphate-selective porin OprO and OprP